DRIRGREDPDPRGTVRADLIHCQDTYRCRHGARRAGRVPPYALRSRCPSGVESGAPAARDRPRAQKEEIPMILTRLGTAGLLALVVGCASTPPPSTNSSLAA